ncbi:Mn2+/Fe2_ transporter, NRAMP family [Chamaesiphon minutus PCC 6605]|uniref:Mn2+/Fe2_transporter, NRAMP family n=2 Tax=Chamaesiphon TaxID=217161 RepID=K9UF19_CHAP6|nr:Mn2+/Fe2_ transporter, NRAMP family [Chamaesiphon minutus PCC 6605]
MPKSFLQQLGPGLITGASDDDPSGIGTYSQVGAQFGYAMLWTMLFSYPLMAAIQEISARIGRVTGHGIAGNMHRYYPRWLTYIIAGLLVIANVINLGADISAMGAALKLLIGGSAALYETIFAITCLLLQIFVPYAKYVNFLKWLTLVLFAYVATVFVVHVPWREALHATFVPSIEFKAQYLAGIIAVFGTTISPYLFFWQASEEVENIERAPNENALRDAPQQAPKQLGRIKADTYIGMGISNLIAFFIILTAAVTLHAHGKTDIQSSAQAAEALRPVAGEFAYALFTAGIIGTGLLAVPVLAGSAAYAVSGVFGWPASLEYKALQAKRFYGVLAVATLLGLSLDFTPIDPIKALFWAAVINGVLAGPVMVVIMLMATNPAVMGQFTLSRRLRLTGWLATAVMLIAAGSLFATWGK